MLTRIATGNTPLISVYALNAEADHAFSSVRLYASWDQFNAPGAIGALKKLHADGRRSEYGIVCRTAELEHESFQYIGQHQRWDRHPSLWSCRWKWQPRQWIPIQMYKSINSGESICVQTGKFSI